MTLWGWQMVRTFSWNGTASTKHIGFILYVSLGDDKDDTLQLMQKAHMATEPILVIRSGKVIFGHEAHSTKGKKYKLPHFIVFVTRSSPSLGLPCYDDDRKLELHLSQSSELCEAQMERNDDLHHYLIYKHWTTELADLTKGHYSNANLNPNTIPILIPNPNSISNPTPNPNFILTKCHSSAHAAVMVHLNRAKAEAIEIRRKESSNCLAPTDIFESSNLPLNTQKLVPRGGKQWIH
jgi:hypothetical protein